MQIEVRADFPHGRHDHKRCVEDAVEAAERLCEARGLRFTALRRRVLELVWRGHRPVRAYDVLARLGREHRGAAPPTVYRALDFLLENGLVHRIELLNAYVGCGEPGAAHAGQFLICRQCQATAELDDPAISRMVVRKAEALGFSADRQTIEVTGLCPDCRAQGRRSRRAG
jgi:Fur family zinc uptake transcriptional regulator